MINIVRWEGPDNEAKDNAEAFCGNPDCDEYVEEDWTFCPYCGALLFWSEEEVNAYIEALKYKPHI